MRDAIDLALQAQTPLPAVLLEHLYDQAKGSNDLRLLRSIAARDDLPYSIRKRITVKPSASTVARWAADAELETSEIDALLASDTRVSVQAAIAGRDDLTVAQRHLLADVGHPTIAWQLSQHTPLDNHTAVAVASTLIDAHREGRRKPDRHDIAGRLAQHGDLMAAVLDRDDVPLAVLVRFYIGDHDEATQRRWVELTGDVMIAAIVAASPYEWTPIRDGGRSFERAVVAGIPGALDASRRILAAFDDPGRRHGACGNLAATVEIRDLVGDDPVAAAAVTDAATAERLMAIIDGHFVDGRDRIFRALMHNPHLSGPVLDKLLGRCVGYRTDTARSLAAAGLTGRAVTLVAAMGSRERRGLLRDERDLPAELYTTALRHELSATIQGPRDAEELVYAASKADVLLDVPVHLVGTALRRGSPAVAHAVVTSSYAALETLDGWPTLAALAEDFDGTLGELVEIANALT